MRYHKELKEGRVSIKNEAGGNRHWSARKSDIAKAKAFLEANHHVFLDDIALVFPMVVPITLCMMTLPFKKQLQDGYLVISH